MAKYIIKNIHAIEILDSRGNPTLETTVTLKNKATGSCSVPSGASTGKFEAYELRDGDVNRYLGKGVLKAVENVNTEIKSALIGKDAQKQTELDNLLIELDGTENKSRLGANAILSVSIALAKAVANSKNIPLYEYLNKNNLKTLPTPMCNILNGGAHAYNNIDIQEFMIMPIGANSFSQAIRWCTEVFHTLGKILKTKKLSTSVGDEGGYAPNLKNEEEALDLIVKAIEMAGYNTKTQIKIALDAAASEWAKKDGTYLMPKSQRNFTKEELVTYWVNLTKKYPIISLEDPLGENDSAGFKLLTKQVGKKIQVVGDDLFVTNAKRLAHGISNKTANSILIKPNQIGTLTETLETIKLAKENYFTTVISHRSGETEDTTIADIAIATNSTQIKTGSLCRTDRVSKYNRLLKIEDSLKQQAKYDGANCFYNLSQKSQLK